EFTMPLSRNGPAIHCHDIGDVRAELVCLIDHNPAFQEWEVVESFAHSLLYLAPGFHEPTSRRYGSAPPTKPLERIIDHLLPVQLDKIRRRQDPAVKLIAQAWGDAIQLYAR